MHEEIHPLAVIHGRFQVLHNDHMRYLLAGKKRCGHLVVGVTNPDPTLTRSEETDPERADPSANPLTYFERYTMIRAALAEAGVPWEEFSVVPLPINLPELYRYYVPQEAVYFLTLYDAWGQTKRRRFKSLGLRVEVLWERPQEEKGLSGHEVRRAMLQGGNWRALVPPSVAVLMDAWDIPARLRDMA